MVKLKDSLNPYLLLHTEQLQTMTSFDVGLQHVLYQRSNSCSESDPVIGATVRKGLP